MKILYVITSTHTGGAEKALLSLVSQTVKKNTVKVVCLKPLGPVAEELRQCGAEVVSLSMTGLIPFGVVRKLEREIKLFQPDLVHAMLYRGIQFARLSCAGKGIKLISSPHFDLSKKSFFCRFIDKMLKDIDTLTVAESFSTSRYLLEQQRYNKNKVFLLSNGVDKSVFFRDDSLREKMRLEYKYQPDNTVFISIARLASEKNPITILQAFCNVYRLHPQARLVFVGEGTERSKLEHFIFQSGLKDVVLLAGEQHNINAWLNLADVFMLSSIEESLPLSLLEALQVGLPCIVSNVGDMPLWVEHGKNGFVVNGGDIGLFSCFMTELLSTKRRKGMERDSVLISQQITDSSLQYQHLYQQVFLNSFHVKTDELEKE
ncbi:MAG: glycosyltransferase [Candidatus Avelusimicrobium sp.]|uniref:glycosyltransferase n=1 Tax=Candidatus Avelusimicrobium sp. TaxID=3048833 RepID=UPI003F0BA68B